MARILLVDDYQNAAESTALFLGMGDGGHEVRIAPSPRADGHDCETCPRSRSSKIGR